MLLSSFISLLACGFFVSTSPLPVDEDVSTQSLQNRSPPSGGPLAGDIPLATIPDHMKLPLPIGARPGGPDPQGPGLVALGTDASSGATPKNIPDAPRRPTLSDKKPPRILSIPLVSSTIRKVKQENSQGHTVSRPQFKFRIEAKDWPLKGKSTISLIISIRAEILKRGLLMKSNPPRVKDTFTFVTGSAAGKGGWYNVNTGMDSQIMWDFAVQGRIPPFTSNSDRDTIHSAAEVLDEMVTEMMGRVSLQGFEKCQVILSSQPVQPEPVRNLETNPVENPNRS